MVSKIISPVRQRAAPPVRRESRGGSDENTRIHAESFLQLCEPVRDQLERGRSFILGMVYQHALAIGGDVEGDTNPGRSGVEQALGRADFDLRSLCVHGADEDIVSKILEEQFPATSTPCGIGPGIHRYSPFSFSLRKTRYIDFLLPGFVGRVGDPSAV